MRYRRLESCPLVSRSLFKLLGVQRYVDVQRHTESNDTFLFFFNFKISITRKPKTPPADNRAPLIHSQNTPLMCLCSLYLPPQQFSYLRLSGTADPGQLDLGHPRVSGLCFDNQRRVRRRRLLHVHRLHSRYRSETGERRTSGFRWNETSLTLSRRRI